MAEQKFLGQAGTDVLVEKVKKNADDILLQIPKSSIFELDMTKKNVLNTLQSLTAIEHGLLVLCKGVKLNSLTLVKDTNSCVLLSRPNYLNSDGENYLFSAAFDAEQYSNLDEGATIAFASATSFKTWVWDVEGQSVKLKDDNDPVNIDVLFSTTKTQYAAGITFITQDGLPYIVGHGYDGNQKYNVIPLGGTSTTSIEEITAQEVSDKFNT